MTVSINLLFNSLVHLSAHTSSAPEQTRKLMQRQLDEVMASHPYMLDKLLNHVHRHGDMPVVQSFHRMMRLATATMPSSALTKKYRNPLVMAATLNITTVKNAVIHQCEDFRESLRLALAAQLGVPPHAIEVSPELMTAEDAYCRRPSEFIQATNRALIPIHSPAQRRSLTNRYVAPAGKVVKADDIVNREFLATFVLDMDADGVPSAEALATVAHNARAIDLPPATLRCAGPTGAALVRAAMVLSRIGNPWERALGSLYSSVKYPLLTACFAASQGPEAKFPLRVPQSVDELSTVLTQHVLHAQFVRGPVFPALRLTVMSYATGEIKGGVIVPEVPEPSAMLNMLATTMSSRLGYSKTMVDTPDESGGVIHFYNPHTGTWVTPSLRIQVPI